MALIWEDGLVCIAAVFCLHFLCRFHLVFASYRETVLERWIRPSLMESCMSVPPSVNPDCFWGEVPVDEWTYATKLRAWGAADNVGDTYLKERLNRHWDTWVTREDISTLAQVKIKSSQH